MKMKKEIVRTRTCLDIEMEKSTNDLLRIDKDVLSRSTFDSVWFSTHTHTWREIFFMTVDELLVLIQSSLIEFQMSNLLY